MRPDRVVSQAEPGRLRPDQADTLESLVALIDAYAFEPPAPKKPEQLSLFGED